MTRCFLSDSKDEITLSSNDGGKETRATLQLEPNCRPAALLLYLAGLEPPPAEMCPQGSDSCKPSAFGSTKGKGKGSAGRANLVLNQS